MRNLGSIVGLVLVLVTARSTSAGTSSDAEEVPPASPPVRPAPATEEPAATARTFSLSMSPLHLVLPFVELAGELRAAPRVGLAVIAGAGRVSADRATAMAYEVGGQLAIYVGDFSGIHAGAELLYLGVDNVSYDATASAAGLAVGPFVGYKWLTDVGFTFVAQAGAEFVVAGAKAGAMSAEQKTVIPLLNLNVGWTF